MSKVSGLLKKVNVSKSETWGLKCRPGSRVWLFTCTTGNQESCSRTKEYFFWKICESKKVFNLRFNLVSTSLWNKKSYSPIKVRKINFYMSKLSIRISLESSKSSAVLFIESLMTDDFLISICGPDINESLIVFDDEVSYFNLSTWWITETICEYIFEKQSWDICTLEIL